MMRNSKDGYGWVAIAFHWTVALLVIGQWALGWAMEHIADRRLAFDLIQWHKSFGFLVLALVAFRLLWRLANPIPTLPEGMGSVEKRAAVAAHRGLYALMFLLPLSGWAIVSTSVLEIPTFAFFLFVIPHLPLAKSDVAEALWTNVHIALGWVLLALAALHVLAALRHHVRLHDTVLMRMIRPAPAAHARLTIT
jgi:cytochrome b561